MYLEIGDYGLIGNCRSAALVGKNGSLDWACIPDFDSGAYFCKILDENKGGYFRLSPEGFYQSKQSYKENTNILRTDFLNHTGHVRLTDFMPINRESEESNSIPEYGLKFIRRIKAKSGNHQINLELKVTPDFALEKCTIKIERSGIRFENGKNVLYLFAPNAKFIVKDFLVSSQIDLKEGSEIFFALGFYQKGKVENIPQFLRAMRAAFKETQSFWEWWASLCRYRGEFEKEILRSALTLKMLTFSPTGAVIAAPTTSLPEKLGGTFNWDYRYLWLRDASFTMFALLGLGYLKEAVEFMTFLEKVCLNSDNLQIMYGIRGETNLTEVKLDHLEGYKQSKPVRIGNGAFDQKQLDVYGELLITINLYVDSGGKLSNGMKAFVERLVKACLKEWQTKDAGIWEAGTEYHHYTYSKVMCWVGLTRGLELTKKLGLNLDVKLLKKEAEEIKKDILKNGFDEEIGAFVDYYGSKNIDSSNFNFPLLGFLPPQDPIMMRSLVTSTQALTRDWFVYRNNNSTDEFKAGEGTFFLTTFWLIDSLSISGNIKETRAWLGEIVKAASSLGLYAEEYDPQAKEQLGNFPQAFTHLGLINSVLILKQASRFGPEQMATFPTRRLRRIERMFNLALDSSLEVLVPSFIRRSLYPKEKRRTQKHSFLGLLYRQLLRR